MKGLQTVTVLELSMDSWMGELMGFAPLLTYSKGPGW